MPQQRKLSQAPNWRKQTRRCFRATARLAKRPEAHEKAFYAIHPRLKKLYLSAYQSSLFDRLLEARLQEERPAGFDRITTGDLAVKHDNGACFLVTDAVVEAARAELIDSRAKDGFACLGVLHGRELDVEVTDAAVEIV